MKQYLPSELKSIAILGHQGSGKTSLVESLLHRSGNVAKKGNVNDGTTVSDFTKEEKNQKISIYSSVIPVEYNNCKYNFIDTPGFFDFESETKQALRAARNAIIVVDGAKGVEVGSRKNWRAVRKSCIPTVVFVNKMDKENINLDELLDQLRKDFDRKAIPFTWPIGTADNHIGYVRMIDMIASIHNEVCDIPAEYKDLAEELRENIIEAAANFDADILEKYFAGEPISNDELKPALLHAVAAGAVVPVVFGSCAKNSGVKGLLDICAEYLPSEEVVKDSFGGPHETYDLTADEIDANAPFSGYVFKTMVDPFVGKISFIKVITGSVSKDQTILNANRDAKERINNIALIRGKEQIDASTIPAGDIGILMKVASLETGDTICDPAHVVHYEGVEVLNPTIYYAVAVKNKNDEGKITDALRKICSEDLSVTAERNAETKQLLVGCQGQSHIDVIVDKLKTIYNIEVVLSEAKISYRETIKGRADVEGRYIKQSGGSGQYGVVKIEFQHSEEHFEFVNDIFGGAVPTNFIPAVQKGLEDAMKTGVLAGFPVIGIKARLYDGKYHPVDSSELAFKMAASFAFKDGCKAAKPTLLEPIMEIVVVGPNQYVGDIMGDLSKRRGIIMGIEPVGEEQYITAEVPQSELQKYIIDLKTMTQAQATFTMKFVRYDEVPSNLVDKIVAANKIEG